MCRNKFRKLVFVVLATLASLLFVQNMNIREAACQSDYPSRPITVYVSFAAGGQIDLCMRTLAPELSRLLGQPVIIQNKVGAGGVVATAFIARQPPDGYNFVATHDGVIVRNPHMQEVSYDPFKDLTPVAQIQVNVPGIYVRAESPLKTFKDLITLVKSSKEPVKWATVGIGSASNISVTALKTQYGFNIEAVPFAGDTPSKTAVLGGHLPFGAGSTGTFGPLVREGRARILVLFTESRSDLFPDVPTGKEFGLDIAMDTKMIMIGPGNLPSPVIQRLEKVFAEAEKSSAYQKLMNFMCITSEPFRGSNELRKLLLQEDKMFGELIPRMGLQKKK